MNIGIDKIGFYVPNYYVDMTALAKARQIDPEKLTIGLGQEQMAVPPVYEDAVTLAANAANQILDISDKKAIDLILVGSETGVDQSKSIAVYVQSLVGLSENVRAVELKQACYGATMALQLAKGHIALHPNSKVLVIATDIAKYGLCSPGEPTQGAGAVAMVISQNPRIAVIDSEHAYLTEDIMDFWRPTYSDVAFADGKFSTEKYIQFFEKAWAMYREKTGKRLDDFQALCFHQPFTKMGLKALKRVFEKEETPLTQQERLLLAYQSSVIYNKRVGNIYTGSLYLSFISLLSHFTALKTGDKIGLFSYGSGAVGEFFSVSLVADFQKWINVTAQQSLLDNREALRIDAYESFITQSVVKDGSTQMFADLPQNIIVLEGIDKHKRLYRKKIEQ